MGDSDPKYDATEHEEIFHNREFCRGFSSPDECCGCPNCTATEHVPGCHFTLEVRFPQGPQYDELIEICRTVALSLGLAADADPRNLPAAVIAGLAEAKRQGFDEANTLWQAGSRGTDWARLPGMAGAGQEGGLVVTGFEGLALMAEFTTAQGCRVRLVHIVAGEKPFGHLGDGALLEVTMPEIDGVARRAYVFLSNEDKKALQVLLDGPECLCNVGAQACPAHPGNLRTKEEKIAFRKTWDEDVERAAQAAHSRDND